MLNPTHMYIDVPIVHGYSVVINDSINIIEKYI
jgi:hypothetical protein